MRNEEVINALRDMKRQIEVEQWTIFANDRGSGCAGVRCINDANIIDGYLNFAENEDNENVPFCNDITYTSVKNFDEDDNEAANEILDCYGEYLERDEILGLVVCHEHFDMDYTFYMLHIRG